MTGNRASTVGRVDTPSPPNVTPHYNLTPSISIGLESVEPGPFTLGQFARRPSREGLDNGILQSWCL